MTEELDTPHRNTCFHKKMKLVKQAERVAIFHEEYVEKIHISVRGGDWYMCRVITCEQYKRMTELDLIRFVGNLFTEVSSMSERPLVPRVE